jgi:hypothetical protein
METAAERWQRRKPQLWRRRRLLLELLGNECVRCESDVDLQFDHINGRDYAWNALSQQQRIQRLEDEVLDGLIQLLCGRCNRWKSGVPERFAPKRFQALWV